MKKLIKLSLVAAISLSSTLYAEESKEQSVTNSFKHMFKDGTMSGNIRSIYSAYNNDNDKNTYASAIGGKLKYELATYNGFNGGVALTTSHDIGFLSGDKHHEKRNDELSSSKGSYTELTEAYINYQFENLNLCIGRQLIDTPLADSDDIRMIPNTFEAYIASYKINNFSLMIAHLKEWQGADAGLDVDNHWIKTGKNGVNLIGLTYGNDFIETNTWYYNISNASKSDIKNKADENGNNAIYLDVTGTYNLNDNIELHAGLQYLKESELDKSNVEANIYGAMAEMVVNDFAINIAYNKSIEKSKKHSFSGYGGGTLFTNMDTMILDEITEDRDARAIVTNLSYSINDFSLSYAYGDFNGNANSSNEKAHIVEQNIGIEFTPNDDLVISAIYVNDNNKEDSKSKDFNNDNFRVLVSYNF